MTRRPPTPPADDGDNDPVGVLGDCTADASIDGSRLREITGVDADGTDPGWHVGLCHGCRNTYARFQAAHQKAIALWHDIAAGRRP